MGEGEAAKASVAEVAPPDAWAEAARAKSERPPSIKSEGEEKSWAETCDDSEAHAWPVAHHKGAPWETWAVQKGTPAYGRPY